MDKTKILVDSYKLFKGQILGKGHHADVYKGIDLTTGQDLAIKVIYKTVNRRLGFVNEDPMQEVKNRRLLNEAWFIDYLKEGVSARPSFFIVFRNERSPTDISFPLVIISLVSAK